MILLRAWMTYEGKLVYGSKIVKKWQNDHEFGFNIHDPENWKRFLSKTNLIRKDKNGYPIVYQVHYWGAPKGYHKKGEPLINLFPGFDETTGKNKKLAVHGKLYPSPKW